jgi:anaerobic ribonucleoside-triphosphate reductase activating protein
MTDSVVTSPVLGIARFIERTQALGPGLRAAVWFHGCSFACPGCIAEEMNQSSEFERISPRELAGRVAAIEGIEGVTLSGGDPFDQPLDALVDFLRELRACSDLSVLCYTGRTLEQLRRGTHRNLQEHALEYVDILIDGLYVQSLNDGTVWRGSSNQRVHFLTPRYRHLAEWVEESRNRRVEVRVLADDVIEITGIPPAGYLARLNEELRHRGLHVVPTENEAST